ncbi:YncE family protein [Beijerinckia indica]|nr:hypothetical protein [Beijerinckia indica]
MATDLIVSANDGKFVRVNGIGTYPRPAPSDSLAIIDADQHPPVIRTIVEGIDHTLQGPPQAVAITAADQDTVTLINVSQRPFRAIQHLNVPATPEAVALSPDGQWIAVQAMSGSNLTFDNPARQKRGKLILFAIRNNEAVKSDEIEGGEAAQGLVFSKDSQTIFVQFNVERKIVAYNIASGKLVESNASLALKAGPASLRTMPR